MPMDTAATMPICADPALAPGAFVAAFMIAPPTSISEQATLRPTAID
jgi:hypothetical protein